MDASMLTEDRLPALRNVPVYTADGEQIGHVGDAYYDENSGRLECVGVAGDAIGFTKRVVPVRGATFDDEGLHLPFGRGDVEASPDVGDELDENRYRDLSSYYGGLGAESVTRSEEELAVGKRDVEAGRVRLRKWVETEPTEQDVELRRETARVERERIDRPVGDADFSEEEVEVPLHAEQPVVEKQAVAKERVSVEKDVDVEQEVVQDELRKERVDVEGDAVDER